MDFLKRVLSDVTTKPTWEGVGTHELRASVSDKLAVTFTKRDVGWCCEGNFDIDHISSITEIFRQFIQTTLGHDKLTIPHDFDVMTPCYETLQFMFDLDIYRDGGSIVVENGNHQLMDGTEVLTEEPNTSLMYHKLFPNRRLLRDLEGVGYKFQMGNGLKIYKKFYASTHRGSGPTKRRTLQSIVILKDGQFFRKIPKSKWVQLADPSDMHSETWGVMFMKKLLKGEQEKLSAKHDALSQLKLKRGR